MTQAKSTCCFCKGPDFNSQNVYGGSQVTVTPALENLMPSSGLPGTSLTCSYLHTDIHTLGTRKFLYVISAITNALNATLAINKRVPSKEPMGQRWAEEMKGKHGKQRNGALRSCVHFWLRMELQ